ncbi:DNA mismatch repair protein MutS [Methanocaldococcus indicus]|uniref:DNA mismatch repair protein MutS n=1 Tax=Methanocaldococcus indicus TaxID=213231 RepID=UPI003C6DA763
MSLTPMMRQYYKIKERYKDCLLFFRVGDFYELFDEDAKIASKELGIVLTSRDKKHPMAGVPYHAVIPYIRRLIEKGYKVAICEQVENPSTAKGLVKREVVRVITPGTLIEEEFLTRESNYLMSIYKDKKYGISLIDISTGEFLTTTVNTFDELVAEILKFSPVEVILPRDFDNIDEIKKLVDVVHPLVENYYNLDEAKFLIEEFINNNKELNLSKESLLSVGAALKYISESLKVKHLKLYLQTYIAKEYMLLDSTTLKNLEIFKNLVDNSKRGSLLEVLDKTKTPMGSRLLKKWLQRPLLNVEQIERRLESVEELYNKSFLRENLREILKDIYDIERIASRIEYERASPKDLVALKDSLKFIKEIKKFKFNSKMLNNIVESIESLEDVEELIEKAIVDDPPINIKDGGIIKDNFSKELDELRELKNNLEKILKDIEERERAKTGIEKLKIGYNSVIGFYIEVPKSKIKLVPKYYKRKQTLANSERYKIDELDELEEKLLANDEKIKNLEYELFIYVRDKVKEKVEDIREVAKKIAELDVLSTFAEVSVLYNYTKPKVYNGYTINIKDARHPTVELNTKFVPNDIILKKDSRIILITGPNMAGKSTYLRTSALITIMAQIGCFVPAKSAVIGVVDRIFTRIGTVDDITRGYSSFMVEISEVAQILKNATSKSLILLDEVGKSTANKDGVSLAWGIVEYLHKLGAKTLFATHYHELSELEGILEGVKNYHFGIIEKDGLIEFDRKIKRGASTESYGIKIAELVLPKEVIERAYEIYNKLEKSSGDNEIVRYLAHLDINNLTPIQALVELDKLVKKCKKLLRE